MEKKLRSLIFKFNYTDKFNISNNKKIYLLNKIENKILVLLKNKKNLCWDYIKHDLRVNNFSLTKKNFSLFRALIKFKHILHFRSFNFFFKNRNIDFIFYTHPRSIKIKNLLYDEFTDDIINLLNKRFQIISFTSPHTKYGTNLNYNNERFYVSYINFIAKLRSILKLIFNKKYILEKNILIKKLYRTNDFKKQQEEIWFKYFNNKKPKKIVLVDKNTNLPIVRAAHRMNISVIELQHGSPSKKKFYYSNKFSIKKENSPDYYLSFGKYWKAGLTKNYYNKDFVNIGKNLSNKIPKLNKISKNWLVLDDIYSRDLLIHKAVFIRQKYNIKVTFRIHPGKVNLSEKDYLILKKNKIKISNSVENLIAKDLKNIKNIICNFSTLSFECSHMNYNVYLLDKNFYEKELYDKIILKKKFNNMYKISNKQIRRLNFYENFDKKKIIHFFNKLII